MSVENRWNIRVKPHLRGALQGEEDEQRLDGCIEAGSGVACSVNSDFVENKWFENAANCCSEKTESVSPGEVCSKTVPHFLPATPDKRTNMELNRVVECRSTLKEEKSDEGQEQSCMNVNKKTAEDGLQQEICELALDSACASVLTPIKNNGISDKDGAVGVNEIAKLRQYKRKHRPKVITEGKPRTVKSTTSQQNLKTKRKYVRKNQSPLELGTLNPKISDISGAKENPRGLKAVTECKPRTAKSATQIAITSQQNLKTKRKYVRKNAVKHVESPLELGTPNPITPEVFGSRENKKGLETYIEKCVNYTANVSVEKIGVSTDVKVQRKRSRKTCRRSLIFDDEGKQKYENSLFKYSSNTTGWPKPVLATESYESQSILKHRKESDAVFDYRKAGMLYNLDLSSNIEVPIEYTTSQYQHKNERGMGNIFSTNHLLSSSKDLFCSSMSVSTERNETNGSKRNSYPETNHHSIGSFDLIEEFYNSIYAPQMLQAEFFPKEKIDKIQHSGPSNTYFNATGQAHEVSSSKENACTLYEEHNEMVPYDMQSRGHNEIVVYRRDGSIVPFAGSFNPVKKRRRYAKVDLDEETVRVWKLLMDNCNNEHFDESGEAKEKRWEEERRVFSGRTDSFIAKMHLIQGDRGFSQWKGSVLDSVIGVFLTQNVSDHLSSSAFMSLAARYPLKLSSSIVDERISSVVNKPQNCLWNAEDSGIWVEQISDQPICIQSGQEDFLPSSDSSGSNTAADSSCSTACYGSQYTLEDRRSTTEIITTTIVEAQSSGEEKTVEASKMCKEVTSFSYVYKRRKVYHTEERTRTLDSLYKTNILQKRQQSKGPGENNDEHPVSSSKVDDPKADIVKPNRERVKKEKRVGIEWDNLRKSAEGNGRKERTTNTMDSLDWEAVRCADIDEIAYTIRERGMNNRLAERIKDFLNRLVKDHGSTDLEWLRDVPPDQVKEFLLSVRGLGLKSVECVRLLSLQQLAFPVDTNVGRIAVRLGWVPLKPLPESLQLHLLELYPVLESIQKYLWPRLCKLDQKTLYELHYQMITFGKVFCTKNKPNCNACPMRGECRHFASAFASARLALPAPEENSERKAEINQAVVVHQQQSVLTQESDQIESNPLLISVESGGSNSEPIIEEPATPEPEWPQILENDIEDALYDQDPNEIPTIKLNIEVFTKNVEKYMQENMELQDGSLSKALVLLSPEAASIPMPKLKNISRLRTEHQVYELPDSHPLLQKLELEKRQPDDPCFYLLAIWTPGETANSVELPHTLCSCQEKGLCGEIKCFSCNSIREADSEVVRGTLLIPCRTAMRGSFPLNGTYFQVNEVFADHDSSLNPINVPRNWLWKLSRRTVYFGTSIPTIFRGLSTEEIQGCFGKGYVCVRGFDRKTRAPRPLIARLHFPASKKMTTKTKHEE